MAVIESTFQTEFSPSINTMSMRCEATGKEDYRFKVFQKQQGLGNQSLNAFLRPIAFFYKCTKFALSLFVVFGLVHAILAPDGDANTDEAAESQTVRSIGLGFLNPSSQLKRADITAFCMQLENQLVR